MSTIQATVGILTFNSGKVLRSALESVREFDEIIICDGGSTDDTLEIARTFNSEEGQQKVRIISQDAKFKNPNGTLKDFGGVRQQCLDAATHDWFLYIDSDETISDGLCEDIRRITNEPATFLVYRVPIGIMLNGVYMKYSSNYPGYQHRFFNKKSGAFYVKPVHERIQFDRETVPIGTLKNPWYVHTTNDDWDRYLYHTAGYRTQEAKLYATKSWGFIFQAVALRGLRTFLGASGKAARNYLLHGFKYSIPISGEIGRAIAPFFLMGETIGRKMGWIRSKDAV
jgi:glycosyltransferase involved in cell wall biosynthesis